MSLSLKKVYKKNNQLISRTSSKIRIGLDFKSSLQSPAIDSIGEVITLFRSWLAKISYRSVFSEVKIRITPHRKAKSSSVDARIEK